MARLTTLVLKLSTASKDYLEHSEFRNPSDESERSFEGFFYVGRPFVVAGDEAGKMPALHCFSGRHPYRAIHLLKL